MDFPASDHEAWEHEYRANVQVEQWNLESRVSPGAAEVNEIPQSWYDAWHAYSDEEYMEMFADG